MLTCEMSEVKSGVITVTNMTPKALRILIQYMYTGEVEDELDFDLLPQIIYGSIINVVVEYLSSSIIDNLYCIYYHYYA